MQPEEAGQNPEGKKNGGAGPEALLHNLQLADGDRLVGGFGLPLVFHLQYHADLVGLGRKQDAWLDLLLSEPADRSGG